jgi:hypothetical protein
LTPHRLSCYPHTGRGRFLVAHRGESMLRTLPTVLALSVASTRLFAQVPHTEPLVAFATTCSDLQQIEGRAAAVPRQSLALISGFVRGLEREGTVDELLPLPPDLIGQQSTKRPGRPETFVFSLDPHYERVVFLYARLTGSCRQNQSQTILEALDAAVTDARQGFAEHLKRKVGMFAPVPLGCVPETGDRCDLIQPLEL